ncbi:lytic transglycosylase domain-containing protein [Roseateles cavernae]|uniref:lytic transglycosylase domain-containing protein n=1 Tax=Roseateles cavernae TaxID=3153578 RepID=UPI0032E3B2F0
MTARRDLLSLARSATAATSLFIKDIGHGLLVVSHNTLALVGLAVVAVLLMFSSQADLRHKLETEAFGWLNARQEARAEASGDTLTGFSEPDALSRATAADPKDLSRQQAAVAMWLSRRYRVAPEPISRLVQEAWTVGQRARVEPTLILAIMAIESGFNPFAQSSVGAQGLMQVLTRVHDDKYEAFGGNLAAFDPITNLRVGVQVLKECIQRAGGIEEGLRYYVGAANLPDDAGYANKVLAEHEQMKSVIAGRPYVPAPKPIREVNSTPATTPAAPAAADQIALLN